MKTHRNREPKNKQVIAEEPPTKRRKIDGVPETAATDAAYQHQTKLGQLLFRVLLKTQLMALTD